MIVHMKQCQTGAVKQAKVGFSWTTLFFGPFVPVFRGDAKWFFVMLIVPLLTFGAAWIIFPFIYNKIYIKGLVDKGYIPADDFSKARLQSRGLLFSKVEK